MNKTIRQLLITYMSLTLMVLQSFSATLAPYRVIGLLNATAPVIFNPSYLLPASTLGLGLATTLLSPKANARVEAPEYNCPAGYDKASGKCMKLEETPILENCPAGYNPKRVNEIVLDMPINTCVAQRTKLAEPLCTASEETGGSNNQQCRTEVDPYTTGLCPSGMTKENGKCVTPWKFPSPNKFICSDLCEVPLLNPTDTCPVEHDPIAKANEINQGICTAQGEEEGKCIEGEVIHFEFPDLEWALENPLTTPTASDPVMCYRTQYEPQDRSCPTPNNTTTPVNGIPNWGTPSGELSGNPAYYDDETGEPITCTRTWMEDYTISCQADYVFDESLNGCISAASTSCPDGTTYSNGQCLGGDGKQCPETSYYDESSSMCVTKISDSTDFHEQFGSGADLGWAIGGLQQSKKQRSNQSGDLTLDMGLLNQDANDRLQAIADDISGVVAIGENDRTHNTYAGINKTYGNEKEQTIAIQSNHKSFQSYFNDPNPEHQNLAAEAYATVDDTIHKNRPPAIDPDSDWLDSSKELMKDIGNGSDPFFGDCQTTSTKKVLNPDKQVVTEETCTKPVVSNFNSCKVQRYVEQPTLKIIEGAEKAEVEIISEDTLRLTIGEKCNNCLNDGGQGCKTYSNNVIIQMMENVNVEKATFVHALYDDMIVISADGNEAFRAAKAPWDQSGWPSPGQSCENGTSYTWNNRQDVTEAFKTALEDDNQIDFNYKIGVGGLGEAYAIVEIKFDQPIRTEWFDEPRYFPEGCADRLVAKECSTTGWECDLSLEPQTLGMENWTEWDGVNNWTISNDGYDAKSKLNGPFSAYGSIASVGDLWFKGQVAVEDGGADDDSFGFMIGYPDLPHFNKDPKNDSYNPDAEDNESNHYFVLLWTNNHGSNSAYKGLSLYKSYVPYTTLESRFSPYWGINFHTDKFETDPHGNSVMVVDNIFSDQSFLWQNGVVYDLEYKQDQFGYLTFSVNGIKRIQLSPDDLDIKSGRFGFATVSLNNVSFKGMHKVTDYSFGPLFPGDSDPSICMEGHAVDFRCGSLADGGALLGPNANVWSYADIKSQPDTCETLIENPECTWISRGCADGFTQPDGSCLMEEEVYQCIDNTNAWEEVPQENTCVVLPCSGGECEQRGEEENGDFSEVVIQIALISEIRDKMECSDPEDIESCEVFKGEQRTCSYDQMGMIDCCEEFEGKTIDLFSLALNMMTVMSFENELFGVDESLSSQAWGQMEGYLPDLDFDTDAMDGLTQELSGVADDVSNGLTNAWEAVGFGQSEKVSEAPESASGETSSDDHVTESDGSSGLASFTDFAVDFAVDAIVDEMVNMAMEAVMDLMPDMIADAIVNAAVAVFGEEMAKQTATQLLQQGAAMVANIMSGIGMAMAIIQIADMLYQLLNGCDEVEQDMPQVLKEKKCYYAYTKKCKKVLGVCQSKNRKRHCCYSSVMSRLIMEQSITQPDPFGGNTFTKKEWYDNETCRGLTMMELPLVDFGQINLDEWYELMVQSGALPDADETLESFTQEDSFANPYGREDALQVQYDKGIETMNEDFREVLDGQDIMGDIDCSATPNIQGCKVDIFGE